MRARAPIAAVATLALAGTLAATSAQASSAATVADPVDPPFVLKMPAKVTGQSYDGDTYIEQGPRILISSAAPFEVRSTRASYDDPIVTVWKKSGGDVTLPAGTVTNWFGLPDFYRQAVRGPHGHLYATSTTNLCPYDSERAQPTAPPRNPYPQGCPYNPFTLGSVLGIQQGWVSDAGYGNDFQLKPGTYRLITSITPKYRQIFGLSDAQGIAESALTVTKGDDEGDFRKGQARRVERAAAKPAAQRPTGRQLAPAADLPKPDLRSLPAFGFRISPRGNYLQFAATEWNGGTSPMVVDGFRRDGEDVMDSYQYFFDHDGNQVGYQAVGQMEWDPRPSHLHWHFEDFAKYELLNRDKTVARLSDKEAWCLANTDQVDYTLPDADWHPDGTDLQTACGGYEALSVRETLAVGSGDTYDQSRAGQSFNLKGLPNGKYWVAVTVNPEKKLVETDYDNNQSLRPVWIGGKDGARTVRYLPVGLVDDRDYYGDEFRNR